MYQQLNNLGIRRTFSYAAMAKHKHMGGEILATKSNSERLEKAHKPLALVYLPAAATSVGMEKPD